MVHKNHSPPQLGHSYCISKKHSNKFSCLSSQQLQNNKIKLENHNIAVKVLIYGVGGGLWVKWCNGSNECLDIPILWINTDQQFNTRQRTIIFSIFRGNIPCHWLATQKSPNEFHSLAGLDVTIFA